MEKFTVLLVDDEEEFSSALAERLRLRGIGASTSRDGVEALELIDAHLPRVVILDKLMPGLSGRDLLARIKAKHPEIAVIMLTGHDVPESSDESEPDSFAYLVKPVNIDRLVRLIRSAMERPPLDRS